MEAPDQSLDLAMDETYTLTVDAPSSLLKVRLHGVRSLNTRGGRKCEDWPTSCCG